MSRLFASLVIIYRKLIRFMITYTVSHIFVMSFR